MMPHAFIFPDFGPWPLLLLAGVGLLLFGNRLPGVIRSLGRSVVEFKKANVGIHDDFPGNPPLT
jgi:sec-independent protein translocase protein TatA